MKKITRNLIAMDVSCYKEAGYVDSLDLSKKMGVKTTYLRKIISVLIGAGVILEDGSWWGDLPKLHSSWNGVIVLLNKKRSSGLSELGKCSASLLWNRWTGSKTIKEISSIYGISERRLYEICIIFQGLGFLYHHKYEFTPEITFPTPAALPPTPKKRVSTRSDLIWKGMKKIKFDLENVDDLF